MADIDTRAARTRTRRALGLVTSAIGVAHFLVPRFFEPFNRLGFPNHARTFTYLNGAVETTIGLLLLRTHTRRPSTVVSACYITHLAISIFRTQLRARRGDGHPSERSG
jgi:uncharacterized membrane protein